MTLLDRDASVIGGSVQFRAFDSHAQALEALNRARSAQALAERLASEVLALDPYPADFEAAEGIRSLQDLARRYQGAAR